MIKLKLLLEKKLRVFDFDDTLVKSNSRIHVTNKGKRKTLTTGEYAIYKANQVMSLTFLILIKWYNPKRLKQCLGFLRIFIKLLAIED